MFVGMRDAVAIPEDLQACQKLIQEQATCLQEQATCLQEQIYLVESHAQTLDELVAKIKQLEQDKEAEN